MDEANSRKRLLLIPLLAMGLFACDATSFQGADTVDDSALVELSIADLQARMSEGQLSAEQLVTVYLQRIETYDKTGPALNAIQHLAEDAVAQAKLLDEERNTKGPRGALHGIPVLVKDNYETRGLPTTAGSKLFAGFAPDRDATLVARLKNAGAIVIGKTTMHEFAYGITTVGSAFELTRNPYALGRNPGGSSGGTGAAVAAGFASVGMGSDTCGSIRIPAAQNNLVGLRGTQGLSSRAGIVPLSSTQDIGGPIARSVHDLALVLEATVGYDPNDAQTEVMQAQPQPGYAQALAPVNNARVGILTDWMIQEPLDEPVANQVRRALEAAAGAWSWQLVDLASPAVNAALDRPWNGHLVLINDFLMDINAYLEANPELGIADLGDLVARGEHHPNVEESLTASLSFATDPEGSLAAYEAEIAQREVVRGALLALMLEHDLDALAYPTIRRVAAAHGEEQQGTNCRLAANSGLPAISVPAGFVDDAGVEMPVGLEFLGQAFSEQALLNLGLSVEEAFPQRRAPVF